jgi:uncharacterized protein
MENFENNSLDIQLLPKFEEVAFNSLKSEYIKVIIFNSVIISLFLIIFMLSNFIFNNDFFSNARWLFVFTASLLLLIFLFIYPIINFKQKGFAFRDHDVLFKKGIIVKTISIIPYSRVQHIAVHQGFISRYLKLATIEIFTAGGSGSDIQIPGIDIEEAEQIKQLLMSKINPIIDNSTTINEA